MKFKNVLVTGGAGFIGSAFVRWAATEHPEWNIRVIDSMTYAGHRSNLAAVEECIELKVADICDPGAVHLAMRGIDAVIHFAAESHVDRSIQDASAFVKTNVIGTNLLLAASKSAGVKRFLYVSTDEVYGDIAPGESSKEGDVLRPSSPYAASKAAAEYLVNSYHITFGMDTVITRGSNTYGSHQYPEKIIPLFTINALQNKPLPIYGNGTAVRDYMHVGDHVFGIYKALHNGTPGNTYNLGASSGISAVSVATKILDILGKPQELKRFVDDRPGHDRRYCMDTSKSQRTLGWHPIWEFTEGLRQTVCWYADNEYWWRERLA